MFSVACFRRPGSNLLLRVVALGNLADSVMKDAPDSAKIRFQGWTNHEHAETQRHKLSDPARGTHGLQPERGGRVNCSAWLGVICLSWLIMVLPWPEDMSFEMRKRHRDPRSPSRKNGQWVLIKR